jgi:hypothetical protein
LAARYVDSGSAFGFSSFKRVNNSSGVMLYFVAIRTEGNQIRLGMVSSVASELLMMHFEVRCRTAELASPTISAEYRQTVSLV